MRTPPQVSTISLSAQEVRDIQRHGRAVLFRPVDPQPKNIEVLDDKTLAMRYDSVFKKWIVTFANAGYIPAMQAGHGWINNAFSSRPFGTPGSTLSVREPFRYSGEHDNYYFIADSKGLGTKAYTLMSGRTGLAFTADEMPDCASRLTIAVRDIQAVRILGVSQERAAEAGYGSYSPAYVAGGEVVDPDGTEPLDDLRDSWTQSQIALPWESNPWIWIIRIEDARGIPAP